jgi:hypothetical protein
VNVTLVVRKANICQISISFHSKCFLLVLSTFEKHGWESKVKNMARKQRPPLLLVTFLTNENVPFVGSRKIYMKY